MMWLSLTAFLTACLFLVDSLTNHELELKFQLRTPGEWEREWHQERYSRCRDSITRHLRWACEKDIYKLKRSDSAGNHLSRDILATKKSENIPSLIEESSGYLVNSLVFNTMPDDTSATDSETIIANNYHYPWLDEKWALSLLRSKRGLSKRSGVITQECCSLKGCTWEEYAEYCTQNNRKVPHKRYDYVADY